MADKLTILFTSDTHGYLFPTNFADSKKRAMGLIPIVRSFREKKDGNTLVIDGGDTIQGSPLTYYCYSKHKPLPVSDVMNEGLYDYFTLGNHDFNNGCDALSDYLSRTNAQCLCANVTDKTGRLPILPATVHTLKNGLRVGLVGITTSWINVWEKKENLTNFTVSDPFEAAKSALSSLQADILVGIYHGGLEKDVSTEALLSQTDENIACRLCEELPFDILLTGHQHIAMANVVYHDTHIVQTPCNATKYARVTVDEEGRISSELITPDADAPLSDAQEALFSELTQWLDTPIGHLSRPMWPQDKLTMALHGSPIADFFNRVQTDATGAELSCTALANDIRGFAQDVTVRDVVATYVYSNTLVVFRVTGQVLKAALEQCARYFTQNADGSVTITGSFLRPKEAHYNYDFFSGIDYTFNLTKPAGSRVVSVIKDGKEIKDTDSFTLCMCNYRATGAGDFGIYLSCPREKEVLTEISELILDYFTAHPHVSVEEAHNIHIKD